MSKLCKLAVQSSIVRCWDPNCCGLGLGPEPVWQAEAGDGWREQNLRIAVSSPEYQQSESVRPGSNNMINWTEPDWSWLILSASLISLTMRSSVLGTSQFWLFYLKILLIFHAVSTGKSKIDLHKYLKFNLPISRWRTERPRLPGIATAVLG